MEMVGLFSEMEHDTAPDVSSAALLAERLSSSDRETVLRHLSKGLAVFDVMEATPDPRGADRRIAGGSSLLTDGYWVWRQDLAAYVEHFGVALPEAFLRHARTSTSVSLAVDDGLVRQVLLAAGWA